MKVIISGATGLVATAVVQQSLAHPKISKVIALSRRAVELPDNADSSKLKQVLVKDYNEYPDHILEELRGAHACIWTVAITPSKSMTYRWEDVVKICQTSTTTALHAMISAGMAEPFHFMYGETENMLRRIAEQHNGLVQVCTARPGIVTSDATYARATWGSAVRTLNPVANVGRDELAAAMIHQVVNTFDKKVLTNADLKTMGRELLAQQSHIGCE
ncbi:putative nucleoside-diphosphate-sugar epimerase protein [Emericellopsis cladophorae]|uniref:Nucleoside-diphosphate-sugar epimerase protein n=1 Tax=Emericellopsis cladophorae TaxID=2686198 RepID=A0A9P9XZ32_9HYPO|nr:putative nucleoside-diphosphate-sugar epimerase protein [Emericellopsis cladophorae]KAI6780507.1 putative nucleoside-diphosphate-sugar epimerase protein [Emericellopsis cladophorae]